MLTGEHVREALRVCFDPELGINVVDLGLVDSIAVEADHEGPGSRARSRVTVTLLQKSADQARTAMLHAQIVNRLLGMAAISQATVETSSKAWSPERLSDTARVQLGMRPASKLIQIRSGA